MTEHSAVCDQPSLFKVKVRQFHGACMVSVQKALGISNRTCHPQVRFRFSTGSSTSTYKSRLLRVILKCDSPMSKTEGKRKPRAHSARAIPSVAAFTAVLCLFLKIVYQRRRIKGELWTVLCVGSCFILIFFRQKNSIAVAGLVKADHGKGQGRGSSLPQKEDELLEGVSCLFGNFRRLLD